MTVLDAPDWPRHLSDDDLASTLALLEQQAMAAPSEEWWDYFAGRQLVRRIKAVNDEIARRQASQHGYYAAYRGERFDHPIIKALHDLHEWACRMNAKENPGNLAAPGASSNLD